jgi:anaerobic ribonucleoside-triphosphate reductase
MEKTERKIPCEGELVVPVECYSRVVGFLTPVSKWNKGKAQEWKDRVTYEVPEQEQGNVHD